MGSILDINLAEREEMTTLPSGEYEFQVAHVEPLDTGTKKARISLRCEPIGEGAVYDIYHVIWLPNPEDTDKQKNIKLNTIASFMERIGLSPDVSKIDLEEWVGCTFFALVDEEELDDGRIVNRIKRVTSGK